MCTHHKRQIKWWPRHRTVVEEWRNALSAPHFCFRGHKLIRVSAHGIGSQTAQVCSDTKHADGVRHGKEYTRAWSSIQSLLIKSCVLNSFPGTSVHQKKSKTYTGHFCPFKSGHDAWLHSSRPCTSLPAKLRRKASGYLWHVKTMPLFAGCATICTRQRKTLVMASQGRLHITT